MARLDQYPLDTNITLSDRLLGFDNDTRRTCNFSLSSISSLFNAVNGIDRIQYKFEIGRASCRERV